MALVLSGCLDSSQGPTPPAKDPLPAFDDPGRVTMRRLNRTEYNNTVRDLLGTSLRPADDFPQDEFGYGFDNNADVLTLSAQHLEMYQRATEALLVEILRKGGIRSQEFLFGPMELSVGTGVVRRNGEIAIEKNGETAATVRLPEAGTYRVTLTAYGEQAGADYVKMALHVNGIRIQSWDVEAIINGAQSYTATVNLADGVNRFAAVFLNDYLDPETNMDRALVIQKLQVQGPLEEKPEGKMRQVLLDCNVPDASACAREILGSFAKKAYRRPLQGDELARLVGLTEKVRAEGGDFEEGMRLALTAILLSPNFVFRPELSDAPTSLMPRALNGYELASRLSYFLWSTMPDDELFALAESGKLTQPEVLSAQVQRMLDSDKAEALLSNFATQWLQLKDLFGNAPDPKVFPGYSSKLRDAMQTETQLYFRHFLSPQGPPLSELLTAEYSFVDATLAGHYGLPAPAGTGFAQVSLKDSPRVGLLSQGSILTLTSYTTRTSPVKRGKWVLEQLLCAPPPPPPPGVEGFPDTQQTSGTMRERLAQHRKDPVCASCHVRMDPIGLGLENYDAIGAYRTEDGGGKVDASGTLDGKDFSGPRELAALLSNDVRLRHCMVERVFTYALGRGPQDFDRDRLTKIGTTLSNKGRLRELIVLTIQNPAFLSRRGEPESQGGER